MGLELVTGYRGTLHITAPQDADLYRGLFGDGRVNVGNLMEVSITAPNEVTVSDGVCLLDGREFFIADGDSVAVESAVGTGTAYLCVCYEKDESNLHETADFQVLESYNDVDIRTGPSASQKPFAKLTVADGTITEVEMLVDTAEPIIDISREAGETLDKVDDALENVDDTLDKINEYFENLSALTERTEQAAENAESAAERAETVAEDALTGVNVNNVPQEIVDHVVNIIAPDQEEMAQAMTDIESLQTENAELKTQIAKLEDEVSELNSALIVTKAFSANQSITASGATTVTMDISNDGYTPLGIIAFYVGNSQVYFYRITLDGNTTDIRIRNNSSSEVTTSFGFTVLYRKNA